MRIKVREKRQITLPAALVEALGVKPGDSLDADITDGGIVLKPAHRAVRDALLQMNRALEAAGVSEDDLLESGREVRAQLAHERWPHLFPAPTERD